MRFILGLSLGLATVSAQAAQTPRTVEYFIMHSSARLQLERTCYGGAGNTLHDAECINAHQADHWLYLAQQQQRAKRSGSLWDSAAFYDANPVARMSMLNECAHSSGPAFGPTAAECQAARISAGGR